MATRRLIRYLKSAQNQTRRLRTASVLQFVWQLAQEKVVGPGKEPFFLRLSPGYARRNHRIAQTHSRKPSGFSVLCTPQKVNTWLILSMFHMDHGFRKLFHLSSLR